MENIVRILLDSYIYIVIAVIILMLALIGYVVDAAREEKIIKKLTHTENGNFNIPNIAPNAKINDSLNKNVVNFTEKETPDNNVKSEQ